MKKRGRKILKFIGIAVLLLAVLIAFKLPAVGAALILHPLHRPVTVGPPPMCEKVTFSGAGATLQGWRGPGVGNHRGTVIYLHGVADNRASGAGVMERFRKRGFDVIAYDSRAHGESGGEACTYGFYEKEDLRRVLDTVAPGPIVMIGSSLGGAVALQLAATDPRISAVVAAESFSDFRTVATERAPFVFTQAIIEKAFKLAEEEGHFQIDAASPVVAARAITVPVLVIHGAADTDTPPAHSQRILEALAGPKRLILVPGAGHNHSLQGREVWEEIEQWIDSIIALK
ncbi:MAG: alpha/beta fold hydrolase [Luteolibacter sp.]